MIKRKVVNGYSVVEICYDRALREMPYAQCGVNVYKDGRIDFISYTTRVITIDADGWLEITGTYSATTRKQIGHLLREYAPLMNYQMVKKAYEEEMTIDIHTGEIKPPHLRG